MSDFFPAESMPAQCCYRFADDSRCTLDRTTHSFCETHAQQIRRTRPSPTAQGPEDTERLAREALSREPLSAEAATEAAVGFMNSQLGEYSTPAKAGAVSDEPKAARVSPIVPESLRDADWILAMWEATKRLGSNAHIPIVPEPAVIERWLLELRSTPAPDVQEKLVDGINALLGLIQLVSHRDDMPPQIREALRVSHRVQEAQDALALVRK